MKFSQFQPNDKKSDESVKSEYQKLKNENPEVASTVEEKLKQYENLNQSQLLAEFMKESQQLKSKGELDSQKIKNIKDTLSPFLSADQQKQLDGLMGMINDD